MPTNKIGQVLSCAPNAITVLVDDLRTFETHKTELQVGRYLQIAQGNNDFTVASIRNVRGVSGQDEQGNATWQFQIECQAVGTLVDGVRFERGSLLLPVPTEPVFPSDAEMLDKLFAEDAEYQFPLGQLSFNKSIPLKVHGDRFFSKHIAVVGSTGSGKSFAVARILHDVVGICDKTYCKLGQQNNSHVIIFDIHDEYSAAFDLPDEQKFTLNKLDIDTLRLPYWLMNSEELESMFIESNEENSHNQVSQFKQAVILNKERHNPDLTDITYDTPVYFSIEEVHRYIENMNREVIGRLASENVPKLADDTLVSDRAALYFDDLYTFVPTSTARESKASVGPFNGQFNRFVSRLETKLADKRLGFLLHPTKDDGNPFTTDDFESILRQFLGYLNQANVTIVDLSGIPFEVLHYRQSRI